MANQEGITDDSEPLLLYAAHAQFLQELKITKIPTTIAGIIDTSLSTYKFYVETFNNINDIQIEKCNDDWAKTWRKCCNSVSVSTFSKVNILIELMAMIIYAIIAGPVYLVLHVVIFFRVLPAYMVYRMNLKKCQGNYFRTMLYEPNKNVLVSIGWKQMIS